MGTIYHHGLPWGDQYSQSVSFTFATTQVPGCIIGLFSYPNYYGMCIWSNIGGGGVTGRAYLGFLLVSEHDTNI